MSEINLENTNQTSEKICYRCISEFDWNYDKKEPTNQVKHVQETQIKFKPEDYAFHESNLSNVKKLLSQNEKVCISLDSTYAGWYQGKNFKQMSCAIKKLGFHIVEETAIGASQVISEYSNLMELGQTNVIINTFCPSVVTLVEQYFPELIENLAPISSPMIAHAKLIRETYGDLKVVYIGSCHSKVDESRAELTGLYVNEVMSFADLDEWLEEEDITIDEEDETAKGVDMPISRLYPISGGLVKALDKVGLHKYTPICVDGLDRCINLFTHLKEVSHKQKIFIEASVCENGCIDSNLFNAHSKNIINLLTSLNGLKQPHDNTPAESGKIKFPHPMLYVEKLKKEIKPVVSQVKPKPLKLDEFICISCGVRSCKDYAISIKDGNKAPFNNQLLSNSASVALENSPNGVITFNENLVITSINPMAEFIYEVDSEDVLNTVNSNFAEESLFQKAKSTLKPVIDKCYARDEAMYLERSIIYVPENNIYILFMTDFSSFNKGRKEYENLRFYADNIAKEITRFLESKPTKIEPIEITKSKDEKEKKAKKDDTASKGENEVSNNEETPKKNSKLIDAARTSLEISTKPKVAKSVTESTVEKEKLEKPAKSKSVPNNAKLEIIKLDSSVDKSLVTIMVGPPFDKYYDTTMVSKLMSSNGIRVVCGKTTSQIVSKITGRSIVGIPDSEGIKDAPTTSIDGIHLITHGVMTISRVLENLRAYQKDPNHIFKMEDHLKEESTILSTFFINECNHVNFLIGDSQDPTRDTGNDPLASFGLKTNLINDLADLLEDMDKRVDLNYF